MIVFPVWPDLGSLTGDTSEPGGERSNSSSVHPPTATPSGGGGVVAVTVADSGLGSSSRSSSSTLSAVDSGRETASGGAAVPLSRLSYSVSYFSWSVSEDSEEEGEGEGGLESLASRLERVRIRRSSRERNELRNAAAASQVSLRLPSAVLAASRSAK